MSGADLAFPLVRDQEEYHEGLTKREWLAGQALAGILASGCAGRDGRPAVVSPQQIAAMAFEMADALVSHSRTHRVAKGDS